MKGSVQKSRFHDKNGIRIHGDKITPQNFSGGKQENVQKNKKLLLIVIMIIISFAVISFWIYTHQITKLLPAGPYLDVEFYDDPDTNVKENSTFGNNSNLILLHQRSGDNINWSEYSIVAIDVNGNKHALKPVEYKKGLGVETSIFNSRIRLTDASEDCSWAHGGDKIRVEVYTIYNGNQSQISTSSKTLTVILH